MRDVKKILGMRFQNHSQRDIAHAIKISRDTVRRIFNAADSKKICWSSVQVNIPKWRSHLIRQNRATYSNLENHLIQITEPGNPI